ncbi:MAG: carboxypeptidase regulatory-like domain-containing protein [Acidobacteria bacterium]|nr:carboxypeptidase regulatory-like domain-containing protein [Acidobacteriota bacterium]
MKQARAFPRLPLSSLVALLAVGAWAGVPAVPAGPAAGSGRSAGPAVPYSGRSDDEVLLMGLRLRYQTLSESFPGFPVKDGILIPLGALCHELDLGIRVDPQQATASGFVISEDRPFKLDVGRQRIEVGGKTLIYIPGQVEVHPDDIYVDTRLLAQWLPLDFKVDRLAALLTVTPREPLPIEQAQERSRNFGRSSSRREDRRTYRDADDPYRWLEVPMVDETLSFSYAKDGNPDFRASSSTFAAGDFLKMTGKLYFNVGQDGDTILRGSLGRTNPDAVLLGPLHARQFQFGDVLDPGLSMVSAPTAGTGAMVTNYPENAWIQEQKRTFRGDLPQGWQVELYQNGALVGLQVSQADGTYEFRDVPLQFGWNDFRLAFYGPQGQRRDERFHVDAEQPLAPSGEFRYLASTDRPYTLQGGRGQLLGAYGFNSSYSGFAAVSTVNLPGSTERYGVAGLQGNWDAFTARLTGTAQQGGGSAAELSLGTRFGGVSVLVKRDELQNDFYSELFLPSPTFIRSRTSLDLSGALPSLERPWITLGLGAQRDEFVNGGTLDRLMPRIGFSLAGWFVNDYMVIQRNSFPGAASSTAANGDLLLSRRLGSWGFRADAAYSFDDVQGRKLQTLAAYVDTLRFQPWTLQAGILHSVQGGGTTILGSATKNLGKMGISINASWSTVSHWTATVSLRMNLAREPRTGSWQALAQASALQGAASGQVFLDANTNGVQDPGEAPVSGAGFLLNGMPQSNRTNAAGVAFVRNLPTDQYVRMAAAQQTLEDPFMQAPSEGWRFLPRPGHTTLLGAAVIMTGDINGTVYLADATGQKPLAGMGIELVDADGKVVAETRSGYDGYYDLGSLRPGAYHLRVKAEDLKTLGLAPCEARVINLLPTGTELDGVDWILSAPAIPAPPAASKTVDTTIPAPTPNPAAASPAPVEPPTPSTPALVPTPPSRSSQPNLAPTSPAPSSAQVREAVLHGRPEEAAQLSKAWLAHTDLTGWAVRAQVGALPSTLLEASEYLDPKDGAILLRPWALSNGQCARQFFVAGFKTKAAAQRYAAHLRVNKELDPPRVMPVKELLGAEPPCSFYAE